MSDDLPMPDFSENGVTSGLGSFMNSWSTGFGSGLNLTSGLFGIIGAGLQDDATEDQLAATEAQIALSQKQNKLQEIQKFTNNNNKLTKVLSGVRASSAGKGITMDSSVFSDALERNLGGYDQDNLSDFANYSFTDQKLEEKRQAAEQQASDEEDQSFFGGITSFFK